MTRIPFNPMTLLAGLLVLGMGPLAAQQAAPCRLPVDTVLATRGQALFTSRACVGCHTIGQGQRLGPDLVGVTEKRDLGWLRRWLKNPTAMLASDSLAKALLAQSNNVAMPSLRLGDDEVEALLHYVARESRKACVK
jgi:mono/diheme cytochrome c family protein